MPVRVALPVPRLDPLTYVVPGGLDVQRGMRVLVTLGNRTIAGTVVESDAEPIDGMKEIVEVLDESPSFSDDMLELTRRVSEYYLTSWGEVLAAALPAWMKPTAVIRIHRERPVTAEEFEAIKRKAPRRAALLEVIDTVRGDVTLSYLQKRLRSNSVADQLQALVRDGIVSLVNHAGTAASQRMMRTVSINQMYRDDEAALRSVFDVLDKRAPKQSLTLATLWMKTGSDGSSMPVAELLQTAGVSSSVVDALVERGVLSEAYVPAHGRMEKSDRMDETILATTASQQSAIDRIVKGLNTARFDPILLHGVTGSGKTLVYKHAIRHVIEKGSTAIVLVPEISLTPQLGDRFVAAFGDRVAILHSRLSDAERLHQYQRISRGEVSVVIGPRSAIFCPIPKLGLIIVDEEHEPSYKQEEPAPRYHGRDVALMRAHICQCPIVLGSATPSLETLHNVRLGRYDSIEIRHRADGATAPAIRIVDMRRGQKAKTTIGLFSHEAIDAIALRIRAGQGTIVFLNRRGYSSELQCQDCGHTPKCPNCDVSLTFHTVPSSLRCHYCGYSNHLIKSCIECGSVDVVELGTGTQRIEVELEQALRERTGVSARITRVDADTTTRRGSLRATLQSFEQGDIDILVGTQMIAKGLDLARVTLVVVVNADHSLHMSDFRASERTYQLLTQVAGRAGRTSALTGEVIIQTSSPDHTVIRTIAGGERLDGDVQSWIEEELRLRLEVIYPPFARFIVFEISSMDQHLADRHAGVLCALLPEQSTFHKRSDVIVPSVGRIRNYYRRVVVVRNLKDQDPSGQQMRALLRSVMEAYYAKYASRDVRVNVDIDASGFV